MEQSKPKEKKIRVFITIQPYNIKFGAMFNPNQDILAINRFVFEQFEKIKIKFEIGRIESAESLAILLPSNHIGDFLKDNSEVTVYSQEYGLNLKTLPGDGIDRRLPLHYQVGLLYNSEPKKLLGNKTNRNKFGNKGNQNKKEEDKKNKDKGKEKEKEKSESKKDEKANDNKKRQDSKEEDKDKETVKEKSKEKDKSKDKDKEKNKEKEKEKEKEKGKEKEREKSKEKEGKKSTQPKTTKETTDKSVNKQKKYIASDNEDDDE